MVEVPTGWPAVLHPVHCSEGHQEASGPSSSLHIALVCLLVLKEPSAVQVNIRDGSVADAFLLEDDFVHASHNFGIHLWDDLLLVVGVRPSLQITALMGCVSKEGRGCLVGR